MNEICFVTGNKNKLREVQNLLTNYKINDKLVPYICILAPFLSYFLSWILIEKYEFDLGFFILIVNGVITFIGLRMIKNDVKSHSKKNS